MPLQVAASQRALVGLLLGLCCSCATSDLVDESADGSSDVTGDGVFFMPGPGDAADDAGDDDGPAPDTAGGDVAGGDGDTNVGPCTPDSCNDGNPCTDDECRPAGCVFVANAAPCDDGDFCNGTDQCAGRTCSMHSGDPCPGTSTCSTEMATCLGCTTDDDCPDEVPDPWSECSFASICAASGTRTRTVRVFSCLASACVADDVPQTEACTRESRDGTSCGTSSCGDWSACDYTGFCDESAQQTMTCTDYVCGGGACNEMPRNEQQSCTRLRNGMTCNDVTCDGFGGCDYSGFCDESAQRSRTCYTHTCGGGSCGSSAFTDTESCSRNRDGQDCDSNPSYCGQTTNCHNCSGGVCVLNSMHYNDSCHPTCGEAARLCGVGAHICCPSAGSCSSVGGGPYNDCGECCEGTVCF